MTLIGTTNGEGGKKKDRLKRYNVTLRRVHETIVAVQKQ